MPSGIQVFASIRNPDAPSQPAARPRTAIRLLFGEALASPKPTDRCVAHAEGTGDIS
jgi:hypothetical protein